MGAGKESEFSIWGEKPVHYKRYLLVSVGLSVVALLAISFATMDRRTFDALYHLRFSYLLLAIAFSLLRWFFPALRIRVLIGPDRKIHFRDLLKVVYGGYFTGVITPLRVGGVTGEAYFLHRYGLDPGEAAAVITFGACISIALLILSLPLVVWLAVRDIHLSFTLQGVLYVALLLAVIFLVMVLFMMRNLQEKVVRLFQRLFPRMSKKGRFRELVVRLSEEASKFSNFLREMAGLGWARICYAVLLSLLFWVMGVITIPVVLVGMGYSRFFLDSLVAQLVIQCLLPFIPVPGGSGFGEAGFLAVYNQVLPPGHFYLIGLLTVLWRLLDFYMGILVGGGAFLLILKDMGKGKKTKSPAAEVALE